MANYTEDRRLEIPDKTPVAMPIGYERPESLQSMIARMVHSHALMTAAQKQGMETFEESDDFDVDDEGDLTSPYQMTDMQEEYVTPKPQTQQPNRRRQSDKESATGLGTEKTQEEQKAKQAQESPKVAVQVAQK